MQCISLIGVESVGQVRGCCTSDGGVQQAKQCLLSFPNLIQKSMEQAFGSSTLKEMALFADLVSQEDSDEWSVLQEHVSFCLRLTKHTHRFLNYQMHAPWVCQAFLDIRGPEEEKLAQDMLQAMKTEWEMVLEAEASNAAWLSNCTHLKWQCYREIMTSAEESSWKLTPELLELTRAWFPKRSNTVTLEQTFNKMRDAEQRHSRHTRASPCQLAAVAIKSTNQILGGKSPDGRETKLALIEPPSSLLASMPKEFSNGFMKRDVFDSSRVPLASGGIPNATDIFRQSNRTSAFQFVGKGLGELDARVYFKKKNLTISSYLWIASVIPEGAVARLTDS